MRVQASRAMKLRMATVAEHRDGRVIPRRISGSLRSETRHVHLKRTRLGRFKLTSEQGHGAPNPTWIPVANETMRRIAAKIGGLR